VSWKALLAEEAFDHIAVKAADRGVFIDSMAIEYNKADRDIEGVPRVIRLDKPWIET
jgi:hypothetical protein